MPIERLLQSCCAAIVPVSEYDKNNLLMEKITSNVQKIYNGVEVNICNSAKLFDSSEYKKVVMCVARIAAPKKFDAFLSIAERNEMKDYLFVWVGGSVEKSMEAIKQDFSIPSNVLLLVLSL